MKNVELKMREPLIRTQIFVDTRRKPISKILIICVQNGNCLIGQLQRLTKNAVKQTEKSP